MDEIFSHLNRRFMALGVLPGAGFEIWNIHANRTLLNTGEKLKGGWILNGSTDFVITLAGLHESGLRRHLCVVFEIKSQQQVTKYGIDYYLHLAVGKLVAARTVSPNQPSIMVVLTDLATDCRVLQLVASHNASQIQICTASVDSMLLMVEEFLATISEPTIHFRLDTQHPRHKDLSAVKFLRSNIRAVDKEMMAREAKMLDTDVYNELE